MAGDARTPAAHHVLGRLADAGLGHLRLGQPLTTLSGGERQRFGPATRMAEKGGIHVLDEPTADLVSGRSTPTGERLAAYMGVRPKRPDADHRARRRASSPAVRLGQDRSSPRIPHISGSSRSQSVALLPVRVLT